MKFYCIGCRCGDKDLIMNEIALIGKKIGMTREFYKTGQIVPVTVLKIEKARVIQVIDTEKRGYKAVQLGFGRIKNSKLTKAMKGYFAKKNTEAKKKLKEFRVKNTAASIFSLIVNLLIFFTELFTKTSVFFDPGIDPFKYKSSFSKSVFIISIFCIVLSSSPM